MAAGGQILAVGAGSVMEVEKPSRSMETASVEEATTRLIAHILAVETTGVIATAAAIVATSSSHMIPTLAIAFNSLVAKNTSSLMAEQQSIVKMYGTTNNISAEATLQPLGWFKPSIGLVTAFHACPAGTCAREPVLWAAGEHKLAAIGLTSGMEIATFALPFGNATEVTATKRGEGAEETAWRHDPFRSPVVALAGNASHLMAITSAEGQPPRLFATPHPQLPQESASLFAL